MSAGVHIGDAGIGVGLGALEEQGAGTKLGEAVSVAAVVDEPGEA